MPDAATDPLGSFWIDGLDETTPAPGGSTDTSAANFNARELAIKEQTLATTVGAVVFTAGQTPTRPSGHAAVTFIGPDAGNGYPTSAMQNGDQWLQT